MDRNGLFGLHCGERSPCTIIGLAWLGARWVEVGRGGERRERMGWGR